jgi:cholesterol transport system auxiliary component
MTRLFALVLFLAGCGGTVAPDPKTFDLGLTPPAAKLPAARIATVRAIAPFESVDMHYRLAFRNAAEIAAYANSRWSAPPADLVRKPLLRAAGEEGKCRLDVELQEFTQVFSAKESSEARLELRASLSHAAGIVSRTVTVTEPNAGPEAASGAAALARAVDQAIGELGRWIATQRDCR